MTRITFAPWWPVCWRGWGTPWQRLPSAEQGYGLFVEAWDHTMPYDLVITDLTMPGGAGGVDLARKILQVAPRARIVASSGYANDPVMSDFRDWGFVGRLPKPFTLEELSEGLSGLDEAPGSPAASESHEA